MGVPSNGSQRKPTHTPPDLNLVMFCVNRHARARARARIKMAIQGRAVLGFDHIETGTGEASGLLGALAHVQRK